VIADPTFYNNDDMIIMETRNNTNNKIDHVHIT